jgi:hypothetical protein
MRRFLGESIQVEFNGQPLLAKRAGCPVRFQWRNEWFAIREMLSEWHRYERRGGMAQNMTPAHAAAAQLRGSRGVGRDYYQVRTETDRVFTLYFDRSPKSADDTLGEWILLEEETPDSAENPQDGESDPA